MNARFAPVFYSTKTIYNYDATSPWMQSRPEGNEFPFSSVSPSSCAIFQEQGKEKGEMPIGPIRRKRTHVVNASFGPYYSSRLYVSAQWRNAKICENPLRRRSFSKGKQGWFDEMIFFSEGVDVAKLGMDNCSWNVVIFAHGESKMRRVCGWVLRLITVLERRWLLPVAWWSWKGACPGGYLKVGEDDYAWKLVILARSKGQMGWLWRRGCQKRFDWTCGFGLQVGASNVKEVKSNLIRVKSYPSLRLSWIIVREIVEHARITRWSRGVRTWRAWWWNGVMVR